MVCLDIQKNGFRCFETFGSQALYLLRFNVPLRSSKGWILSETDTCWGKLTDQLQCVSVCVCVFSKELENLGEALATYKPQLKSELLNMKGSGIWLHRASTSWCSSVFWAKKSEEKVDCWLLKESCLAYVNSYILFISMIQTTRFSDPHSSSRHRIVLCLSVGGGSTITESRIKPKLQNLHGP